MYVTTTRRSLEPFSGLRRLNSVLDEAFAAWPFQSENGAITASWTPAVDVSEDKTTVKIVAELPGVKSEDVKLSIENKVLTIRGEKKQEAEEKTERVHRYERSYGVFERAFALPNSVDPDKIEAGYENGILNRDSTQDREGPSAGNPGQGELTRPTHSDCPRRVRRGLSLSSSVLLRSVDPEHRGFPFLGRTVPLERGIPTCPPCHWRQPP